MNMGLLYEAEAKTVAAGHATVSWKEKGVMDDLGNGNRVFGGTITGIILVKRLPKGSVPTEIHADKLDCQAIFRISENNEERHTALCIVKVHEGKDLAYGEIRCAEKKDECKGRFMFVWGTGGFKGITRKTRYIGWVFVEDQKEGRIYENAHWPELTYSLPWGFKLATENEERKALACWTAKTNRPTWT